MLRKVVALVSEMAEEPQKRQLCSTTDAEGNHKGCVALNRKAPRPRPTKLDSVKPGPEVLNASRIPRGSPNDNFSPAPI